MIFAFSDRFVDFVIDSSATFTIMTSLHSIYLRTYSNFLIVIMEAK